MQPDRRRAVGERLRRRWRGAAAGEGLLAGWAAILLGVVVVTSIGLPLVGVGSLHASDVLQRYAPWAHDAPTDYRPENANVSDTVDATLPVRAEWSRRLRDGDLPLWSSFQAGGSPLAAIPNASTFGPLNLPYLVLPLWAAPAIAKLLEMAVAGGFAFLFLRRLGVGRVAGLVAAIAYVDSGFQVVWTNWPQSHVGALVPALFWAVDRAVGERRAVAAWPVAVVSAAMWFEGFPAVTLWAHAAAGVFAIVRAWPGPAAGPDADGAPAGTPPMARLRGAVARARAATRPVGAVAAGFALAIGIAALQLLPFAFRLQALDLTYREDVDKIGVLPWRAIATLVVPDAYGNPAEYVWYGARNYIELQAFAGATTIALVLAAAVFGHRSGVGRRVRWFVWGSVVLAAWLIWFGGPLLEMVQSIPVIGSNSIGRLRSLLGFGLAVLAGVGVDALLSVRRERWRVPVLALLLAVAATAFGLVLASVQNRAQSVGRQDYFGDQLVLPVIAAAIAAAVVLGAPLVSRTTWRRAVVAVLPAVLAVEAVAFAYPFWPRIERQLFYPETPVHTHLAATLGHDRFVAGGQTMFPGTNLVYGLRSVTAHTLTPPRYADLLLALDPAVFDRNRTYPVLPATTDLSPGVLDRLSGRALVLPPTTPVAGTAFEVTREATQERLPPGATVGVEVPQGPLRAVRLSLHEPIGPGRRFLAVEVLDARGEVIGAGRRRVHDRDRPGPFDVAVLPTGDDWPDAPGPWGVAVTHEGTDGAVVLGVDDGGAPALSVVRPADDGLEVTFAEGATVYARATALPRIRWASRAEVVADPGRRVARLAAGVPPDTVVLDAPGDETAGRPGRVTVTEDDGDVVAAVVEAEGPGYLVVADAIEAGWVATLDGEPAEVVAADHAFGAVHVPAGTHEVVLRYDPPGWSLGQAVTFASVLLLLVAVTERWWRPRLAARRRVHD